MEDLNKQEIAVIGMTCRFPGADDVNQFWNNLLEGKESIHYMTDDELREAGVDEFLINNPNYVKAVRNLKDIKYFDADFFDYTRREAELMLPQMRLFHECTWEALENSGYSPEDNKNSIGLYVGSSTSLYWEALTHTSGKSEKQGIFAAGQLSDKDYLARRISYKLNLTGPSIMVQTACSTSLVAIHLACNALKNGDCDMAVAGGVAIYTNNNGYLYQEGLIYSKDGHNRTFDAKASGTMFADGIGVVVLKPLHKAIEDNDTIHAIVKGTAVNNDGLDKAAFQAPSIKGQTNVIHKALKEANVGPETISFIDAHGTATILGDPIEVEALSNAYNTKQKNFCAIGSVKANIGHTDAAAGVAGFMKSVLALKNKKIPPAILFDEPNPKINFEKGPFYVNTELVDLANKKTPNRAGVSSFGIGGTNAHVILEEPKPQKEDIVEEKPQILLFSAKTENSLNQSISKFTEFFKENSDTNLRDAAFTLQFGRKHFAHRKYVIASKLKEAIDSLESLDNSKGSYNQVISPNENRPVAFMFAGQGAQYLNMMKDLYTNEEIFRKHVDYCFDCIKKYFDFDLKEILFYDKESSIDNEEIEERSKILKRTEYTQPSLFIMEFAMAKLFMHYGIVPQSMIGHSIGEYVAACISNVFNIDDALRLVVLRGKLMQSMPLGSMLSVNLKKEDLTKLLNQNIEIAAVNTSKSCVVSGEYEYINSFALELEQLNIQHTKLHTSHAFHSKMMDPILDDFLREVSNVELNEPSIPFVSNLTGDWITVKDATNPLYWVKHLRQSVYFAEGIEKILSVDNMVLLELGPGRILSTFVLQHESKTKNHTVINAVKSAKETYNDQEHFNNKLANLWLQGVNIEWSAWYQNENPKRIPLPTYSFDRKEYWIEGDPWKTASRKEEVNFAKKLNKNNNISEWFYVPFWYRDNLIKTSNSFKDKTVLVFQDTDEISSQIAKKLNDGNNIITVTPGDKFEKLNDNSYAINPECSDGYQELFSTLKANNLIPDHIVHAWSLMYNFNEDFDISDFNKQQERGLYSMLYLAKSFGKNRISGNIKIHVITNNIYESIGNDLLCPENASILGAIKVIPQEYPNVACKCIDIDIFDSKIKSNHRVNSICNEILNDSSDFAVSYRGKYRWLLDYKVDILDKKMNKFKETIKENGTYVMSGGFGGIAYAIATKIAETVKANIILLSRSGIPKQEEWEDHILCYGDDDKTSVRIKQTEALIKLGSNVEVYELDVADEEKVKSTLNDIYSKYKVINGIIHSAGLVDGGVIHTRTKEETEKIMSPKVKGAILMNKYINKETIDFLILCSSIKSLPGVFGQVGYCAANDFLDAFSFHNTNVNGVRTISINWDAWEDVGMAAESFKDKQFQNIPTGKEYGHPLLNYNNSDNKSSFKSFFTEGDSWILDEHRVLNDNPTLPGTGFIEMVYSSFSAYTNKKQIQIENMNFLTPLYLEKNETKEVEIKVIDENTVEVTSNENKVHHARAKVSVIESNDQRKLDISSLEKDCDGTIYSDMETYNESLIDYGPRWRSCKWVKLKDDKGLAYIELPEQFKEDLKKVSLHPGIMDIATGFYNLIAEEIYFPMMYGKIKVYGTIPQKLYSYYEYKKNDETLTLNVKIMDLEGNLLLEISDYVCRRLSSDPYLEIILGDKSDDEKNQAVKETSIENPEITKTDFLTTGLTPEEGLESFGRLLNTNFPQIVVSSRDLNATLKYVTASDEEKAKMLGIETISAGELNERPELETEKVEPRTETEKILVDLYQNLLGCEVGILDDFFELGGDSLKASQLLGQIQKRLYTTISVSDIFMNPNVEEIAKLIDGEVEEISKIDEILKEFEV